jgi:hypothetical protein
MGTLYSVSTALLIPINSSPRRRRLLVATPMAFGRLLSTNQLILWTYFPKQCALQQKSSLFGEVARGANLVVVGSGGVDLGLGWIGEGRKGKRVKEGVWRFES